MASSPLFEGYLIRNPRSRKLLQTVDWFLQCFFSSPSSSPKTLPESILLCNLASLGDVLISTCVIPVLKKAFPGVRLGFLIGSWADAVLKEHPDVTWVHHFNHGYISPKPLSWWQAFQEHRKTRSQALQEIRQIGYDWAIDLYCYFPNAIPLLKRTQIPVRVGYTSGGFGPFLTHPFAWQNSDVYMGTSHLRLLQKMGLSIEGASSLPDCFSAKEPQIAGGTIVLHMGSSSPLKDWPISCWKQLIRLLKTLQRPLLFTGRGQREAALIQQALSEAPQALNLCDKLSWKEFAAVIQQASLVISADSVSVHLAAAFRVPTLVLFSGINAKTMWVPPYDHCMALQAEVPCSPCFQKQGCKGMDCLRKLTPQEVFQAVTKLVGSLKTTESLG